MFFENAKRDFKWLAIRKDVLSSRYAGKACFV